MRHRLTQAEQLRGLIKAYSSKKTPSRLKPSMYERILELNRALGHKTKLRRGLRGKRSRK